MEDVVYHMTEDELRAWMDAELVRLGRGLADLRSPGIPTRISIRWKCGHSRLSFRVTIHTVLGKPS